MLSDFYRKLLGFLPAGLKHTLTSTSFYHNRLKPFYNKLELCHERQDRPTKSALKPITISQQLWPGPLVSVIVTCYNYGVFLDSVLACLKAQTERNFEIILIDDGSTDSETVIKIEELKKLQTSVFTVIQQPNQGVIAARNNAIAEAKGKYIFPLDADDTIEKTFLEKCLLFLENSPEHFFVYSWTHSTGEKDFVWETRDSDPAYSLIENRMGYALFRKTAFIQAGGYNPVMAGGYEDWEFCVNLVAHGYIGRVIREPLYNYYVKPCARNYHAIKKHEVLKDKINDLHRVVIKAQKGNLFKLIHQSYRVKNSLINFSSDAILLKKQDIFLVDFYRNKFDKGLGMADIVGLAESFDVLILLTLKGSIVDFFNEGCPDNLFVYYPEHYHPEGEVESFYTYLEQRYQPQQLTSIEFERMRG